MAIGLSGFSSGGGNPIVPDIEWVLSSSQNWSPPFKCKVLTFVIGAGGLSAKQAGTTGNRSYCTSGAGAGGCAASILTLDPAVSYTVAIGAGASHTLSGTQPGVNGGDTSFSGSDIDPMIGQGGRAGTSSQTTGQTEALGGDGGIATGGNLFNATGGAGGDAFSWKEAGAIDGNRLAGGGGSVGILGKGYDGGSATWVSGTLTSGIDASAGGAGVGGSGGTIISTRNGTNANLTAGGGGTYGPGADSSGDFSSDNTAGGLGRAGAVPLLGPEGGSILLLTGAARNGNSGSGAYPEAGVGSEGCRTNTVLSPGIFAGGGGVVGTRTNAASTFFGGGTGGHATQSSTSSGCKAGDGVVIIKLLEIIE